MAHRVQAITIACNDDAQDSAIGEPKAALIGRYCLRIGGRIDVHSAGPSEMDRLVGHLASWHEMSPRDLDELLPMTEGSIERLIVVAVRPPDPGHPSFAPDPPADPDRSSRSVIAATKTLSLGTRDPAREEQ
jgi:hypothetical protein